MAVIPAHWHNSTVSQLVSIPLVGGMDQSVSTVVGEPRIREMVNCRLIEPGRVATSPGWYWSSVAAGARAVGVAGETVVIASSASGWVSSTTYTAGSGPVNSYLTGASTLRLPAVEPPIRVDTGGTSRDHAIASWALPSGPGTPTIWGLLSVVYVDYSGTEIPSLAIFDGATLRQSVRGLTSGADVAYRCATDYTTGIGYIVKYSSAGSVAVLTMSVGSTPLATWRNWSSTAVGRAIRDVACTTTGGVVWFCLLMDDGFCYVYSSAVVGGGEKAKIDVSTAPISALTEIAMYQDMLLRSTYLGSLRIWQYTTGTVYSAEQIASGGGSGHVALGKQTRSNIAYLTLERLDATTGQPECESFYVTLATGTSSSAIPVGTQGTPLKSHTLVGAPVGTAANVTWQQVSNYSTILRSFAVTLAQRSGNGQAVYLTTGADGEMPTRAQMYQCGVPLGTHRFASASPVNVSVRDSLCGELKSAYVFASHRVTGGQLATANCDLAPFALLCAVDSAAMATATKCAIEYDCLDTVECGGNVAFLAAHPWLDGPEQIATGFQLDGPPPFVAPVNSTSAPATFANGAVYQYCVRAEYRDAAGTLYRSAPTQPIVYTVVDDPGKNHNSHTVTVSWQMPAPATPGSTLRLFRTVAGGSVFYDTEAVYSGASESFTDSTSDASLIGGTILIEGPIGTTALKSKYGFPPCRFGWRGKDRVIVGGIEHPNRVRWSQLLYPGEAVCFPHASEQAWAYDFPEPITAVASLDDAWVVFSATRIWCVYGCGPDDNGMSGAFDPPRVVSTSCGAISWRSIAEIPEGILFQASDAQIYLLQRGQLTTQWFSAPVRLELSRGVLGTKLRNPITATIPHNAGQTVHFVRAPMPGTGQTSPIIVYDKRTNSWSLESSSNDGLNGALSGGPVLDVWLSTPYTGNSTVCTITPTHVTVEDADDAGMTFAPDGETAWASTITTNDISPFGVGGWGKVQRIGIIGEVGANDTFSLSMWQNRKQGVTPDAAGSPTMSNFSATDMPFLSWAPAAAKASSVRLKVAWGLRSTYPTVLVLSVEPLTNAERTAAGRRA
jgi:hypothetical protein